MATNEILQFASTNTGTNLLTQAEYTADAQRTTGNQPGIARSKLVNKALRQSSLLAAGLAEFIADYQANNVTDSLTPQNIADYLVQAIYTAIPQASETEQGRIELATAAEVQTGTDTIRAVTPAGLSSRTATETRSGLMELATTAEAQAGSNDAVVLTPLKVRQAFNASGQAPVFACRAWAQFSEASGVLTVIGQGNLSLSRISTGRILCTFNTPMPSTNYCVLVCKGETDQTGPLQVGSPKSYTTSTNTFEIISNSQEGGGSVGSEFGNSFVAVFG